MKKNTSIPITPIYTKVYQLILAFDDDQDPEILNFKTDSERNSYRGKRDSILENSSVNVNENSIEQDVFFDSPADKIEWTNAKEDLENLEESLDFEF
jgi:hypothetical protein